MPKTNPADLCYVYCVCEGAPASLPATGMPDGRPPRHLSLAHNIALIVSDVPATLYAAEVLEPRLNDLDWVGTAGSAHHQVIEAAADQGVTVLPFRLFTLFSSEQTALSTLESMRPAMTRAFDRVRGKQEWVLRIGRPEPAKADPVTQSTAATAASSGTSFLQAKADARREAAQRLTRVREDAAAAFEALEQLADGTRNRPVEPGGTLMIDAAFLLPPDRVTALQETLTRRAERLLRDGCPVSLTGPWPPYSFASMEAPHA